jgi:adenylyltransferase/sulfurtransferase
MPESAVDPQQAANAQLSKDEIERFSRHLILPEVTMDGQKKLKAASVLVIGAGGLGAPVSLYLAAAGLGRIGLVDFDDVEASNLQRQVLFGSEDVGKSKLEASKRRLQDLNPYMQVDLHSKPLNSETALDIIRDYDLVVDGTDNFPTRYCVNDACVMLDKPNVYGSIFRFEGQATVFDPRQGEDGQRTGPCYRCLYPEPPPPGMVPSCAEGGVLGILPGVVGCIQATEAIKLILGIGNTLTGRLMRYSAMDMSFKEYKLRRDTTCPVCGDNPTVTELIDYQQFCGMRGEESDTIVRDEDNQIPEITVGELKQKLDSDGEAFELIDVREPHEHQICNLDEARLVPLNEVPQKLAEFDSSKQYIVHCKMGGRSAQAVELMRQAGLDATNVKGGITAWAKEIDPDMPTY